MCFLKLSSKLGYYYIVRFITVGGYMFVPYALIYAKLIDPLCISEDRVALRNGVYPTGSEPRTSRDQQPRYVTTYAMAVLQQV